MELNVVADAPRVPAPLAPASPVAATPRRKPLGPQLLILRCDACNKPLTYSGTGRYPVTCPEPSCQRAHRRLKAHDRRSRS